MKRWAYLVESVLVIGTVVGASLFPAIVQADVAGCSALFSDSEMTPNSQTTLNLQVNNAEGDDIAWIKVSRPSPAFEIQSATSNDFTVDTSDDSVIFTGSTIGSNQAYNKLNLSITTSATETTPQSWRVEAASDPSGANAVSCDNVGLDVGISDDTGPVISTIAVATTSPTSADISWETDEDATSSISYGTSLHYGSTSDADATPTTEHSISLSGLTPSTSYHFQISSQDGAANQTTTDDNTFATPEVPKTVTVDTTAPLATRVPILAEPVETSPPTISITTSLDKPFPAAPTIRGTAADNVAIADVQYSTDGGLNWLPADSVTGANTPKASFSFTPQGLVDGNFKILARAIDTSGNTALSDPVELIIDAVMPSVGGIVISNGPQILSADDSGTINTLARTVQKITLSAIGGPTHVVVQAQPIDTAGKPRAGTATSFVLAQTASNGLWSGLMSFTTAGRYSLKVSSIDGAGNTALQSLNTIDVTAQNQLLDNKSHRPVAGQVTVHYFEPELQRWQIWDGSGYGQTNPVLTTANGAYGFTLPAGTYYLEVKATGYQTEISRSFVLAHAAPIATSIALQKTHGLNIPTVKTVLVSPAKASTALTAGVANLIGKQAPDFSLASTDGRTVRAVDLLGKPTLLSFVTTWLPSLGEQLPQLAKVQAAHPDYNIVPISLDENAGKVQAFAAQLSYPLQLLSDPDGGLAKSYGVPLLPTNIVIDRTGIVRSVSANTLDQGGIERLLNPYQ